MTTEIVWLTDEDDVGDSYYTCCSSPVGQLMLVGNERGLVRLVFLEGAKRREPDTAWIHRPGALCEVVDQLRDFFAGRRREIRVTVCLRATEFERRVWQEVVRIPFGQTASYGEIAGRIGQPRAARAVGGANHRNPLPIIVPCHRVLGSRGELTGYGSGLPIKEWLLNWEARTKHRAW